MGTSLWVMNAVVMVGVSQSHCSPRPSVPETEKQTHPHSFLFPVKELFIDVVHFELNFGTAAA